jgi:hypothetical protein
MHRGMIGPKSDPTARLALAHVMYDEWYTSCQHVPVNPVLLRGVRILRPSINGVTSMQRSMVAALRLHQD